jgi:hypothetical protein
MLCKVRFRELERQSVKERGSLFAGVREMRSKLAANGHAFYIA